MIPSEVHVLSNCSYNTDLLFDLLPNELFNSISPGDKIVIKPNWIRESHQYKLKEWEQVITHPSIISAVIKKVVEKLNKVGKISIVDAPETNSNFNKILSHYPIKEWDELICGTEIIFEIIDLRDDEWIDDEHVIIARNRLPGDPRGSVEINLKKELSEFYNHSPNRGYYGADSNIKETNNAHNGSDNLYRVSKTVLEADVFINIPKLKTHKKAGITSNLKNLVGINTYKNFLPHNSIGTLQDGGDQFPEKNAKTFIESQIMPFLHQKFLYNAKYAKFFSPLIKLGKTIFGDNSQTIRGGSWYGNNTIWRMILDLNKILMYANDDGTMKLDEFKYHKNYISVVDAIVIGEGNGPKAPDAAYMGRIFCGFNPVSVDAVCAIFMGFDPQKIPSISKAFQIIHYPLTNFKYEDISVKLNYITYKIKETPVDHRIYVRPQKGWIGHIELE